MMLLMLILMLLMLRHMLTTTTTTTMMIMADVDGLVVVFDNDSDAHTRNMMTLIIPAVDVIIAL